MRSSLVCVALLCILSVAFAQTCPTGTSAVTTTVPSQDAGAATKFNFANNLGFNPQVNYVSSSSSAVTVSVGGCIDTALLSKLGFAFTTSGDTITLAVAADGSVAGGSTRAPSASTTTTAPTTAPGQVSPINAAGRNGIAPITTFAALACGLLLAFRPKSASSVVMILALLGVAVYAHADSAAQLTITIGIPDSITSVNGAAKTSDSSIAYVNVMGARYATLDQGAACSTTAVLTLPAYWRLATSADASVFAAIALHDWKADGLVLADGSVFANLKFNQNTGSNGLTSSAAGYSVTACNTKILMVQTFSISNPTASILSAVPTLTNTVTFNGYDYAAVDNTAYASAAASSAQSSAVYIPTTSAWTIAADEDATAVALAQSSSMFATDCVVVAGGKAYNSSWSSCGSAQLTTFAVSGYGTVYAVTPGSSHNMRVVVRRASTAGADTYSHSASVTMSYVLTTVSPSVELATLDNKDPNLVDSDSCQARFMSVPTGWSIAPVASVNAFMFTSGSISIWKATAAFASSTAVVDRSATSLTTNTVVTKTVNGVVYYATTGCARTLIQREYTTRASFDVGMKLLYISQSQASDADDIGETTLFLTMMQATGIPYDWVPVQTPSYTNAISGSFSLVDAAGNPKYYGIVMSSSGINKKGTNDKVLTPAQNDQIAQYMYQYNIRRVCLNGYPTDYTANAGIAVQAINGTGQAMTVASAFATAHSDLFSGVSKTASFDISNQYMSWPVSVPAQLAPALTASINKDSVTRVVAGIWTEAVTNVQTFQFWVGNADFLDHGPVLANVWLTWLTRGVWIGNRRIYLSPQIDDYFLKTEQYGDPVEQADALAKRITGTDVDNTATYLQNTLKQIAPPNSYITLAMAINGAEANDDLISAAQRHTTDFWWESHTWTHLNFNTNPEEDCESEHPVLCHVTNFTEASLELSRNNDFVQNTLFAAYGGLDMPTWSRNSMITPAITGLFNPLALAALAANNLTCVVGDNSRPELIPDNPYLGMYTTMEKNNYTGIFIIPRWATEIYYNSAIPSVNVRQYNERYGPDRISNATKQFFTVNSTLDDILQREGENNFRHLAFFRHDPFMFHQCNLIHFDYTYVGDNGVSKKWSLVTLWLQTVIDRYNQMLTFPLLGVKQQDLRDIYFARRQREVCGISGTLAVSNGQTSAVTLQTTGACTASLTGPSSCGSLSTGCKTETYAQDSTAWVDMVAGSGRKVPVSKSW